VQRRIFTKLCTNIEYVRTIFAPLIFFFNQTSTFGARGLRKFWVNMPNRGFYSASALLAVQSAVLARGILSVCLSVRSSVCLSVTFRYCVQTNEDTIVRFSASGRTIPLVSGEIKFIRRFAGYHP